jgi:hypothetical protein
VWVCHSFSAGLPLPPTPQGIAYLSDHDETDPRPPPEGTGITCHQIDSAEGLRQAYHAWRYFRKLMP